MAKASVDIQVQTIRTKTVTLLLSEEEAQLVADVLAKVGGSPTGSRRKYQDDISRALDKAGYQATYPLKDVEGALTMRDFGDERVEGW